MDRSNPPAHASQPPVEQAPAPRAHAYGCAHCDAVWLRPGYARCHACGAYGYSVRLAPPAPEDGGAS